MKKSIKVATAAPVATSPVIDRKVEFDALMNAYDCIATKDCNDLMIATVLHKRQTTLVNGAAKQKVTMRKSVIVGAPESGAGKIDALLLTECGASLEEMQAFRKGVASHLAAIRKIFGAKSVTYDSKTERYRFVALDMLK
jgi:hypothetical protein